MALPYDQPASEDLGSRYRGDTIVLPVAVALNPYDDEAIIDLTGATVWFTAKDDLSTADGVAPGFQLSNVSTGVTIIDGPAGEYQVVIPALATDALTEPVSFFWDIQVRTPDGTVTTIRRGKIKFLLDTTRAIA